MLNANPQDDRASIVEEANDFEFGVPVLKDETQMVASSLGVKRTNRPRLNPPPYSACGRIGTVLIAHVGADDQN